MREWDPQVKRSAVTPAAISASVYIDKVESLSNGSCPCLPGRKCIKGRSRELKGRIAVPARSAAPVRARASDPITGSAHRRISVTIVGVDDGTGAASLVAN